VPDYDPADNYDKYGRTAIENPFTACAWYAEKGKCGEHDAECRSSCCMDGLATKVAKLGIVGPERELLIKLFKRAANGEHTLLHEMLTKK
jgi:hypothetical protein